MKKNILNTVFCAVLFFAATMPFREFFRVMEVTEMRPAAGLTPVLGLMTGVPGALGCALGNFIADLMSGYSLRICAAGFPAQLFYGIFPYAVWRFIKMRSKDSSPFFRLNNVKNLMRYIVIILTNSMLMAVWLGIIFSAFGMSPFFSSATLMVLFNNWVFGMILGIPVVVLITRIKSGKKQKTITLNERFVLIFILLGVVPAGMTGVFAYIDLSGVIDDPLNMWNHIYIYVAASITVIFLITVIVLSYIEKYITIPIESLADVAKSYVSSGKSKKDGEFIAAQCENLIKIRNETGTLADAFRKMVLNLDDYIDNMTEVTAERERISAELDVAAKIQASMLPSVFPPFPDRNEFELYADMQPAREVGGDFYDFFLVDESTIAVVMADVSGKGVPAALFMVIAKTLIKNNAQDGKSPKEVFEAVNNILCENNDAGMFVTAFMGYLDIPSGKFSYVNAGHNPPLIRNSQSEHGRRFEWLKLNPGFVLAGMEDMCYTQYEIALKPGDELFLYTDGVTEAVNNENKLFTDPLLLETANSYIDLPLKEFTVSIKREIDKFAGNAEQADDITMLVLRYKGE
ncbi:MAG: SpoIIE family protein phosphatase [Oscillospiraceae bacterium]|nr:SpoIIE family protein phosphatase [Oscillospiraceae bacterium]